MIFYILLWLLHYRIAPLKVCTVYCTSWVHCTRFQHSVFCGGPPGAMSVQPDTCRKEGPAVSLSETLLITLKVINLWTLDNVCFQPVRGVSCKCCPDGAVQIKGLMWNAEFPSAVRGRLHGVALHHHIEIKLLSLIYLCLPLPLCVLSSLTAFSCRFPVVFRSGFPPAAADSPAVY